MKYFCKETHSVTCVSTCFCRWCSQHHLKKLEGRRLDFDYKKKRQGKIPDEEIRQAVEKFDESKELAERSMFNFLENDVRDAKTRVTGRVSHVRRYCLTCVCVCGHQVEQVNQLSALIKAALEYHQQSCEILQELSGKLQKR